MQGVDLPAVKKLMGHFDIQTTMIYAHLASDHLSDAVDKLSFTQNETATPFRQGWPFLSIEEPLMVPSDFMVLLTIRRGASSKKIINQIGQVCDIYAVFAVDVGCFHYWRRRTASK